MQVEIVQFGALAVTMPTGLPFSPPVKRLLATAFIADYAGLADFAKAEVAHAEVLMGVPQHLRSGSVNSDAARNASREQRHRARLDRNRATSLLAPDVGMNDADKTNMARADEILTQAREHVETARAIMKNDTSTLKDKQIARAHYKAAKPLFDQVRRICLVLERNVGARRNEAWVGRALMEIATLEAERGDKTRIGSVVTGVKVDHVTGNVAYDVSAPLIADARDGLALAFKAGVLDHVQASALLRYRELYESTDPERGLKPAPIDPSDRKVGRGGDGWADKRHRLWTVRQTIEAKVATMEARRQTMTFGSSRTVMTMMDSHAITVLHEVAGKGHPLSKLGKGRAHKTNGELLTDIATVVATHYGMLEPTQHLDAERELDAAA